MAVEIKELVFRAVVKADEGRVDQEKPIGAMAPLDREAIVHAAVKEVLRIVKGSKER